MTQTITYYVYTPSETTPGLPCRVREDDDDTPDAGLWMETLQPNGKWKDSFDFVASKLYAGDVDLDEIPEEQVETVSKAWLSWVNSEANKPKGKKGHAGR